MYLLSQTLPLSIYAISFHVTLSPFSTTGTIGNYPEPEPFFLVPGTFKNLQELSGT